MAQASGRDVLQGVARAAAVPAIRRIGTRPAGVPRTLAETPFRSHGRRGSPELAGAAAAPLGLKRHSERLNRWIERNQTFFLGNFTNVCRITRRGFPRV